MRVLATNVFTNYFLSLRCRLRRYHWYQLHKYVLLTALAVVLCANLSGCDLLPRKPEDVFVVYRERMISEQLEDARKLLSQSSLDLVNQLERNFDLKQPPEALALLNILEPTSPPLIKSSDDTTTILQVRTLTGGLRLVSVTRRGKDSHWKIDLSQELSNLQKFLETREALEKYRGQAGEFAGTWKKFMEQLDKMKSLRPPPTPRPIGKDNHIKKKRKKGHTQRKHR